MIRAKISIDKLIEIVKNGGTVTTGIDIYNENGVLLLEQDVPVNNSKILEAIKQSGILNVPINPNNKGGVWDAGGKPIKLPDPPKPVTSKKPSAKSDVEKRLKEIATIKKEASTKHEKAKQNIKKVLSDIKATGGEFDYAEVEKNVSELYNFISENPTAFSYLTKEIFSYDDYLYNHSINVCTIGTAILRGFNAHFSDIINKHLANFDSEEAADNQVPQSFIFYQADELRDISLGFFLHDVGKVLISESILNKKGKLSDDEFGIIKTHSFEKGMMILEKNNISNPFITKSIQYHHANIFLNEPGCYPQDKKPIEIPSYAKVCKLADIYDAMTSKRAYKDAVNPISVVTDLFRKYAQKDRMLQFIMLSFVKAVGIYPPGSIALLLNKQMVYIIDSKGPIVIPITDSSGMTLKQKPDPVNLATIGRKNPIFNIDKEQPLISPIKAYDLLPAYLRDAEAA